MRYCKAILPQNKCQWILKCLSLKGSNELLHLLGQKGAVILSKFINNRRSEKSQTIKFLDCFVYIFFGGGSSH